MNGAIRLPSLDEENVYQRYLGAFAGWAKAMRRTGQIKDPASLEVYEDMWIAFARYCSSEAAPVNPEALTRKDLNRFIQSRGSRDGGPPSARYVWRLLNLIDRVLAHEARNEGRQKSPVAVELLASRPEWQYANTRRGEIVDYLVPGEAKQLVEHLSRVRARPGRNHTPPSWQQVRNCAAVGLQLGAGVTPGEVRELTVRDVFSQGERPQAALWKLRVRGDSRAQTREVPIASWAGRLLRHWLQTRDELGIPGDWLFPSTKTGKPWSKPAQYLAVCTVLKETGWTEDQIKGGAFRLRHTYALRQLRRGFDEPTVAKWLGIELEAMARYREILMNPVPDLA